MKLHEISYNEQQWKVHGSRSTGYKLVNTSTFYSYTINGGIIGMVQIADDTFLVYSHFIGDKKQIKRFKFFDGRTVVEYKVEFNNYEFLTDDIIIFDIDISTRGTLYSITKNQEIDDLNHLISQNPKQDDASYVRDREITLLYKDEDSDYPSYLLVDYKLQNTYITNEHLQLLIDPISLKPITPVYSTLRDKFITLGDSTTLKSIVEEENNYLWIINGFLEKLYNTANTKTPDELISMVLP